MADTNNYTKEQVEQMGSRYTADPTRATVDALANEFGKSVRSIIAKQRREGVYVAQQRTTKAGEPVIRKADLVAIIQTKLEVEKLETLVKASKADLETLLEAIQ